MVVQTMRCIGCGRGPVKARDLCGPCYQQRRSNEPGFITHCLACGQITHHCACIVCWYSDPSVDGIGECQRCHRKPLALLEGRT